MMGIASLHPSYVLSHPLRCFYMLRVMHVSYNAMVWLVFGVAVCLVAFIRLFRPGFAKGPSSVGDAGLGSGGGGGDACGDGGGGDCGGH